MKFCPACQQCYEEVFDRCAADQSALVAARPRALVVAQKYRIDRLISRGLNAVYEGTQLRTARPVAIKLILPDADADAGAVRRYRQEALAVAHVNTRVDHQHVVRTIDYGLLPDGIAYVVMELAEGRTLREHLDAEGKLPADDAARIARQTADGLEAAHGCGVLHGDLRPSNIILARDCHGRPEAKVINTGFARLRGQAPRGGGAHDDAAPAEGGPRYASPEQLSGHAADARADVYSLGLVLSEMLTGRTPPAVPATGPVAHLRPDESSPQGAGLEGVPGTLAALVRQALDEKPSARLQSAAEFARRLRAAECPPGLPPADVPEDGPAAEELPATVTPISVPTPHGTGQAAAAHSRAARPARNIGLVDDYSSDSSVEGVTLRPGHGPRAAAALSAPAARLTAGAHATAAPRVPDMTPPQTRSRPLFAFAIPALLVLILGAVTSSWLASRSAPPAPRPPASPEASADASNAAPNLGEPEQADAGAAERPEAEVEATGLTPGEAGHTVVAVAESSSPGGDARARPEAHAAEGGIDTDSKIPDRGTSSAAAAQPQGGTRVSARTSAPDVRRAGQGDCAISTSKSALKLRGNGGADEIAVSLDGPGASAAVTATTGDWANIAVLAAPTAARGGAVYRVVSVSRRGGTYAVTFKSPCGSKRVAVTVE